MYPIPKNLTNCELTKNSQKSVLRSTKLVIIFLKQRRRDRDQDFSTSLSVWSSQGSVEQFVKQTLKSIFDGLENRKGEERECDH